MKRRILALIGVLVLAMSMEVSAASITMTGDSYSDEIQTNFTVTEDMLGGVIVSIPAELILTPNSGKTQLTTTQGVTAYGNLGLSKHLEISVPSSVTYKNDADNSITVPGALTFGTSGTEEWTPAQLLANKTNPTYRDLTATVNMSDIDYSGVYRAIVTFNVDIVTD